jgi:RHS repeat-associated protein
MVRVTTNLQVAVEAAWASDNSRLALSSRGDLFTVKPDGTGLTNITNAAAAQNLFPEYAPQPRPKQLYFIHPDHLNTPRLVADKDQKTVWRWDQQEPFGVNVPDENPSGLGAFEFPMRFPGQYADKETNLHYNYFRDYDPSLGIYKQSDLIGLRGGLNTYLYVGGNPLSFADPKGLDGGPYHPPAGVSTRCTRFDSCPALRGKMWVLKRMIDSHQGWDWNNPSPMGGGRHAEEIDNLWRAYARCQVLYEEKCREKCPAPDLQSIGMGFGALGLGVACALNPLACGIGIGIGGAVGGGLAPAQ